MVNNRFTAYAWFVLIYNIAVILWGAFVRATGSGAGCGNHWPLCNGQVVPLAPEIATIIEFTHRIMSGVSLLLVLALVVWAFRVFPKGHIVRVGAAASGVFIITEALIGAGLVLLQLVAHDTSVERVYSISLHLVNTFLLIGSLVLTAWWASGRAPLYLRGHAAWNTLLGLALLGVIVIGVTGAITALGDTLFPAGSLSQGLARDVDPTAHFLERLRVVHPLIAILVGGYLWFLATYIIPPANSTAARLSLTLRGLVVLQLVAGAVNVFLLAPVWMQLLHLLLADLVWLALVLYAAATLTVRPAETNALHSGAPSIAPAQ